jgi:hypothetical protein
VSAWTWSLRFDDTLFWNDAITIVQAATSLRALDGPGVVPSAELLWCLADGAGQHLVHLQTDIWVHTHDLDAWVPLRSLTRLRSLFLRGVHRGNVEPLLLAVTLDALPGLCLPQVEHLAWATGYIEPCEMRHFLAILARSTFGRLRMLRISLQRQDEDLSPECLEYLATILRIHVSICHLRLGGIALHLAALGTMLPATHAMHIALERPPSVTDSLVSMSDDVKELAVDVDCSSSHRVQALFDTLEHFRMYPASRRNLRQIVVAITNAGSSHFLERLRVCAISLKAVGIDLLRDDGTAFAGGPAPVSV